VGYTTGQLRIPLRAERHNGPGDEADNRAIERLKTEIATLIELNPEFRRVAPLSVEGGV
jgi:hypothetical protein